MEGEVWAGPGMALQSVGGAIAQVFRSSWRRSCEQVAAPSSVLEILQVELIR